VADPIIVGNDVGTDGNSSPGNASSLSQAQLTAATLRPDQSGTSVDATGGAWRIIEVPAASNAPRIVKSPLGWLALSRRSIGDSRAPLGYESVLYRSTD